MIFTQAPLRGVGKHPVRCSNMKTVNAYLARSSNIAATLYVTLADSTECFSSGAAPARHTPRRSVHGYQRQLDETCIGARVIDVLHCLSIVSGFREQDVLHEDLRIPVIKRKPARLHLDHDAVARQEHMVRVGEVEAVEQGFIRGEWLGRLQAFAITAPENVRGDHQ